MSNWRDSFIKKFVNNHGTEWRPLRGLWHEEVLEFISQVEQDAMKRMADELIGLPEYKYTSEDGPSASDLKINGVVDIRNGLREEQRLKAKALLETTNPTKE